MRSLGVQRVLTSPYHPEGNAVNERSHRTMNNMLRACLLEGTSSRAWVEKVPGLMLTLNAMVHEPHGFSASMVATEREPTLPPDLQNDACASPSLDNPTDFVEVPRQHLSLTHQQMTAPLPPASVNPHQEGSLIFVMTTPPERANRLTPRWKGPFRVKRVPNPYQVVYEDGSVWRTVHVNHTKPAKLTAPDLPLPTPAPEPPRPALGYLPRSLQRPCSRPPPPLRVAACARGDSLSPTSEMPPPATAPTSQPPETAHRPRRSLRLHPELGQACALRSPPGNLDPRPKSSLGVTNTHPLVVSYNQCLGAKEDPYAFASLYLEDLRNGQAEQLDTMQQLTDALPKMEDPTSRFALRGHIARPDQPRLQHSMRAALWWTLPSDGEFRRASHSLQYYLARQGRRLVLRGGDVTQPKIYENRLFWIPDPTPPSEAHPKLPGRSRRRRRRKKKATAAANKNSAPRTADRPTPPTLSANRNSARWASSRARQPGTRSTSVEHLQSFAYFSHDTAPHLISQ